MAEKRTKEGIRKKFDYINRYNREKQTPIAFRFNHNTDKDILEHLDKIDNKTKYIKDLIRKDMEDNYGKENEQEKTRVLRQIP